MLAEASVAKGWGALALRAFRHFLASWPDAPLSEGVRQTVSQLEPSVENTLRAAPFPQAERFEMTCLHEEIRACLALGEYAEAAQHAERLLSLVPDFVSALNNLSQAYYCMGRGGEAVALSREALKRESEKFARTL